MKTLLIALNSKFLQSNLAINYLKAYSQKYFNKKIHTIELNINDPLEKITDKLLELNFDIYAFSCYIFNVEYVKDIIENIKAVFPEKIIIVGGPEVSYDAESFLKNTKADIIVNGEGELTFSELIQNLGNEKKITNSLTNINGITFKLNNNIIKTNARKLLNLDEIPSPFELKLFDETKNYTYYETSRGCPFNCSYCISSLEGSVRYFSLQRVFKDLNIIINSNISSIRFVDRTFNIKEDRAIQIMKYLYENSKNMYFQFEFTLSLITDKMVDFLLSIKRKCFKIEIGIQTSNSKSLEAITRKISYEKVLERLNKIIQNRYIDIHIGLIAGLPFDNIDNFKNLVAYLLEFNPNMLQVGLLKLLPGTILRNQADKYNIKYNKKAPYQILKNDFFDYKDIIYIKKIDYIVDNLFNNHEFEYSFKYLKNIVFNSFDKLIDNLIKYFDNHNLFEQTLSKNKRYQTIYNFGKSILDEQNFSIFYQLIKIDILKNFDYRANINNILELSQKNSKTSNKNRYTSPEVIEKKLNQNYIPKLGRYIKIENINFKLNEFLKNYKIVINSEAVVITYNKGISKFDKGEILEDNIIKKFILLVNNKNTNFDIYNILNENNVINTDYNTFSKNILKKIYLNEYIY